MPHLPLSFLPPREKESSMRVKAVPNSTRHRGEGVRGFDPLWSLQSPESKQYVKKGLFGTIKMVSSKDDATTWVSKGRMIRWARDRQDKLQVVA